MPPPKAFLPLAPAPPLPAGPVAMASVPSEPVEPFQQLAPGLEVFERLVEILQEVFSLLDVGDRQPVPDGDSTHGEGLARLRSGTRAEGRVLDSQIPTPLVLVLGNRHKRRQIGGPRKLFRGHGTAAGKLPDRFGARLISE